MSDRMSRPRFPGWASSLVVALGTWTLAGCGNPERGTVEIGVDRDAVNQQILNPGKAEPADAGGASRKEPEKIASPGGKSLVP